MSNISRGRIRIRGFKDSEMDFQLIRQLGATAYRAASIGECLNIPNVMDDAVPKDWVQAFTHLAEWQKEDGLERLRNNHVVSGREQLLKACNAFRAAEYYSPTLSEQHRSLGLNSVDCFKTAIGTMDLHFESHAIPYNDLHLPMYFISPANDGQMRKTVLIVNGFDGTMEESFFTNGFAAIERGYNVILFAGPGQMDLFRNFPETYFEPDFENVVKKVIDFFADREEINMAKLSLLGLSIGGYFAIRAASHEPRIKALIANSPVIDVHDYLASFMDFDPCDMADEEDFKLEDLPSIPEAEFPPALKEQSAQLMIRYGRHSFKNTFMYLKKFTIGAHLNSIKSPCLALIGAAEGREPRRQFDLFCQATNASQHVFSDFEGASMHCQVGNHPFANAIIYDWLDSL